MVDIELKLESDYECPTQGGIITFSRGELLSGVLSYLAVFIKNKYMPYRVSLAVRGQDLARGRRGRGGRL